MSAAGRKCRDSVTLAQRRMGAILARRRARVDRHRAETLMARRDAAAVLSGRPLPSGWDGSGRPSPLEAECRSAAVQPVPVRSVDLLLLNPMAWAGQGRETLLAALHSLSIHRLRSLLTTVGIVIGVAAVIILVALGNGLQANFNAQFGKLANQIIVVPATGAVPSGGVARKLTDQDVAALQDPQRAPDIASVAPSMTGSVSLAEGQAKDRASLVGATLNYLELMDRSVAVGSWFTPAQVAGDARAALLGGQAVELLWGPGADLSKVIGSPIRVNHTTFRVQGILVPDGQNDNVVIVPFGASRAYLVGNDAGKVDQIILKSTSVSTVDKAADELTDILNARHYIKTPADRDFDVRTFTALLAKSTQFLNFLRPFIVAVAAISLIVGGIGVANIMLVSVTERTREIGIRRAVGASRRAILRQFLSEAVMLTGLGGFIGVVLGVGVTEGGGIILPKLVSSLPAPVLTCAPVLIAFGVSLVIGVLAGAYPANRAARLRPIDALRSE